MKLVLRLAAFGLLLLLGAAALLYWKFWPESPAPAAVGVTAAASPVVASPVPKGGLEAAVRAIMPQAGLFKPEWLQYSGDTWNLRIPRRRDPKSLGLFVKAALEAEGVSLTAYEDRDFPQWHGFYIEADGEKLVAVADKAPALAICIDDWGYHEKVLAQMVNFPGHLTTAILPGLPFSRTIAEASFKAGHEVILHLPVEPLRKMPMLPGTLLVGMPLTQVDQLLDEHAATVPHMDGLNNHEGSKGSADPALMDAVCAWLHGKDEFFLDSMTNPKSVVLASARKAGIPYAARRVFLDDVDQPAAIETQMRQAIAIALKSGSCIAIGHPKLNTMTVLTQMAALCEDQGIDLVRVSDLTYFDLPRP